MHILPWPIYNMPSRPPNTPMIQTNWKGEAISMSHMWFSLFSSQWAITNSEKVRHCVRDDLQELNIQIMGQLTMICWSIYQITVKILGKLMILYSIWSFLKSMSGHPLQNYTLARVTFVSYLYCVKRAFCKGCPLLTKFEHVSRY